MIRFTETLLSSLTWYGKKLRLNLAYDTVLTVYEIMGEKELTDEAKIDLSLDLLVKNKTHFKDESKLLSEIFNKFVNPGGKASDGEKVVDFWQDADYIFASFFMDYGIDLIAERGKLDWRKFIALFSGLSEKSKMREVINIRSREVPATTKHNAKEVEALRKAKSFYALKLTEEEAKERWQRGLDKLGAALEQRAVRKNG